MFSQLVKGGIISQRRIPSAETRKDTIAASSVSSSEPDFISIDSEPPYFITSTPPVVFTNSRIIAATHPNVKQGHPSNQGWFLSDFYAFNYLLKGLGSSQTWLTAADPQKLLRSDPPHTSKFLHGSPSGDRQVVLSTELLEKGELTPVTVVQSSQITSCFLEEVRIQSQKAKREEAPLVLLLFCHGLPNFSFVLDYAAETGITMNQIRGALEPGCRATLLTTACYSSGWAVKVLNRPMHSPLNATIMAAAHQKDESVSWQGSKSLGRFAGSIFASAVIKTLTSRTSPLLDGMAGEANEEPLQPEEPTPQQAETYNEFCRSILDVCKNEVTTLWDQQTFTFSAQNDSWDHSWTGRTGIPLTHFEDRWRALEVIPYTGPPGDKLAVDTSTGESKTAGRSAFVDEMTKSICQRRVCSMARLYLQTCPGDENRGWGPQVQGTLRRAVEGKLEAEGLEEALGLICFRWELGLLADYMVEAFGLPKPGDEICVLWDSRPWRSEAYNYPLHSMIFGRLVDGGFLLFPAKNQGPPFTRFLHYMAAAVTLRDLEEPCTNQLIDGLLLFMTKTREFYQQRVVTERTTLERAQRWLKSLGKKMKSA